MRYLIAFRSSSVACFGSVVLSLLSVVLSIASVIYTHVEKSRRLRERSGIDDAETVSIHFDSAHTILGLAVLVSSTLHLVLNLVLSFSPNAIPLAGHSIIVGFCGLLQVAAIVAAFFGFVDVGASIWMFLTYSVWVASLVCVTALLEGLIRQKKSLSSHLAPRKSVEMETSAAERSTAQSPERRGSKAQVQQLVSVTSQGYQNLFHAFVASATISILLFGGIFLPSVIFSGWNGDGMVPAPVQNETTSTPLNVFPGSRVSRRATMMDDNCTHAPEAIVDAPSATTAPIATPAAGIEANALRLSIISGDPFVSAKYGGGTPRLRSQHAIASVNGQSVGSTVSDKQFVLKLSNGQTWLIVPVPYENGAFVKPSSPLSFRIMPSSLSASTKFFGVLRVALIPQLKPDESLATLADASFAWPLGGRMSYSTSDDSSVAYMKFDFGVEAVTGGPQDILLTAIPHHRDNFVGTTQKVLSDGLEYATMKGKAQMVRGASWTMEIPLVSTGFFPPRPVRQDRRDAVLAALRSDADQIVPIPYDTYSFGKVASRFARLALIADELGENSIRDKIVNQVIKMLDPWVHQTHGNSFLYDRTWGGLISTNGRNDAGADYGVGWYNDQHYHFGYFVYAAAVVAKYDENWASSNQRAVEDMIRNYANPQNDTYFPSARMKDWYTGHSWASGLFEFADGKNQESTSESVNGYYAVHLWGLATSNRDLSVWGRILMSTELLSTHRYWHMFPSAADHTNGEPVYEEAFRKQTCVGIVWSTKVDYATWFGGNVEFIHGIQMLPYTPITETLLPKKWISVEFPILVSSLSRGAPALEAGWRGFVVMTQSILDADVAWDAATKLSGWDNGNSKTNTLHFIATRP